MKGMQEAFIIKITTFFGKNRKPIRLQVLLPFDWNKLPKKQDC